MNWLALFFLAVTLASFAVLLLLSVGMHRNKPADLSWRGIIKLVALNGVPSALNALYQRWLRAFWSFFVLACVTVAVQVWAGDHSFLVVIFPLLFYYFFARYFLWEKDDLTD